LDGKRSLAITRKHYSLVDNINSVANIPAHNKSVLHRNLRRHIVRDMPKIMHVHHDSCLPSPSQNTVVYAEIENIDCV